MSRPKSQSQVHTSDTASSEVQASDTASTTDFDDKQSTSEYVVVVDESSSFESSLQISTQHKCCSHVAEFQRLVIASLEAMKEQLVRIEARTNYQQKNDSSIESFGIVDVHKLKDFGVPVDSLENMLALENNLKDERFRTNLVSFYF